MWKIFLVLFSLFCAGSAGAREMGLPLLAPPGAPSGAAYATALRGEGGAVKMNCNTAAHAAAYQLFLRDATPDNLPVLMENLEVRPLPPGGRVRTAGLRPETCKPFTFERDVRKGELGLWSSNLQDFIGSASCGNPVEVLVRKAPAPALRQEVVYADYGNTPWISETGDGLDWGKSVSTCHEGNECGQMWASGRAFMYSVAAVLGAALLPEYKSVQNITTKVTGGMKKKPPGGPVNPAPPPSGGPVNPAPVPPGGDGGGPRNPAP